jgi:chitinase
MTILRRFLHALVLSASAALSLAPFAAASGVTLTTSVVCKGGMGTGCGEVSQSTTTCKRNCIITVQAYAATNWNFDHWEGDASGTTNPTTVRMTSDKQVTAVFVSTSTPPPPPPPRAGPEVIGYFIQWGIYARNYLVRDVVRTGAAPTLSVINYAFAGIADDLTCASLDTFADWGKRFDASESVDGVGDTVAQPLKGNFNQLKKLKALHPQIRVVISVGGWNDSARFSDAALPANRARFVASCVNMFIKGQFAAGIVDAGVFDGIDIDWEYPGACGATCNWRTEDTANFTALLQEFRDQLDAASPNRHLLLTVGTPAAKQLHDKIALADVANVVDWMNVMTYDFHGSWEPSGPTNHHANLYEGLADPSEPRFSADGTVREYFGSNVPAGKIALGLPFYGRGWARVPEGSNHGLYQSAGSIPRGTYERGIEDYKTLKSKGYPEFWDNDVAKASWLYSGSVFWTFDSPRAVTEKIRYVCLNQLKGVMFWELSGDDGTLVKAIADHLAPTTLTCP